MSQLFESQAGDQVAKQLMDEARYFVYAYNTTTLVTTGGLALGLFFIITALALYWYYYSTTPSGRSGGEWEYQGRSGGSYDYIPHVLEMLERAFVSYGVHQEECRRRVLCEAHLPNSHAINAPVADALREIIRQVTVEDTAAADAKVAAKVEQVAEAVRRGFDYNTCAMYEQDCPHMSLQTVHTRR